MHNELVVFCLLSLQQKLILRFHDFYYPIFTVVCHSLTDVSNV